MCVCIYIYIYIYIEREREREICYDNGHLDLGSKLPVSAKKHPSRQGYSWKHELSEHQIRGWIAEYAVELQGKAHPKGSRLCRR